MSLLKPLVSCATNATDRTLLIAERTPAAAMNNVKAILLALLGAWLLIGTRFAQRPDEPLHRRPRRVPASFRLRGRAAVPVLEGAGRPVAELAAVVTDETWELGLAGLWPLPAGDGREEVPPACR